MTETQNPNDLVPPSAVASELALLHCMLFDAEVRERWAQELKPEHFARPHNALIFTLLAGAGSDLDPVLFHEDVAAWGQEEACGGRAYLMLIFTYDANPSHAPEYARHIREAAENREVLAGALTLAAAAAGGADQETVTTLAEQLVTNAPSTPAVHSRSAKDILRELTDKIEDQAENPRAMLGLSTGFSALDAMTNGLQAPNFLVIGARPGVGKSALLTKIASHVARQGEPTLLFSMEMSQEEVMLRMVCAEARLDNHALRAGRMTGEEYDRYAAAAQWLYDMPLDVNDKSGATPAYMRGEIRKFMRKHGRVGLVCVDYLQLMRADKPTKDRLQELTEVSIELKGMARDFGVPLIALSQLNRASTLRPNKRPDLADIRETGQIEQDADIVAFLYREDMFGDKATPFEPNGGVDTGRLPAELIFRKHRNGPQGTVMLDFVEQFALFLDQPAYDGGF